jgi:hypothetical protein
VPMNCEVCRHYAFSSNSTSSPVEHIGDLCNLESDDIIEYSPQSMKDAIVNISIELTLPHSDVRKDGSAEGRCLTVAWHMPLAGEDIWKSICKS